MAPFVAEDGDHEIGGSVHHLRAFEKALIGIDESAETNHTRYPVEVAECRFELREQISGTRPRRFLTILHGNAGAQLAFGNHLSGCVEANLARHEDECAG